MSMLGISVSLFPPGSLYGFFRTTVNLRKINLRRTPLTIPVCVGVRARIRFGEYGRI
jgi:hypothetical protein